MSARPTLLFYCQHSLGLGHLARSYALCQALVERFRVVLLSGGEPTGIAPPDGLEVLQLPPLRMGAGGRLEAGGEGVEVAQAARRQLLLRAFRDLGPAVVLVELFPFGRRKFAGELLPLLEAARRPGPDRALVACSLRDILVGRPSEQEDFDEQACERANRLFDAVLVHCDPRFARLEDSFRPHTPLQAPLYYTGFVVPRDDGAGGPRRPELVVSAGGGVVGGPLLLAAAGAHAALRETEGLRTTLIAGPFTPEAELAALRAAVDGQEGLELHGPVGDLRARLRGAAVSVSQCGYNTALDLLRSGVPALVVPFARPGEDEQTRRAQRLEALGAARMLHPERLDAAALAEEVRATLRFRPRPTGLDFGGAERTSRLLAELYQDRAASAREAVPA